MSSTIALGDGVTTKLNFSFVGVNAAFIEVIFTDVAGTETVLTCGAGSAQDQIVLNAPAVGATWGVGGVVPYAPNGVPIAAGTSPTMVRTLPLTQAVLILVVIHWLQAGLLD